MFIYDAVCEGCGDCSVQSSCISVEAKDTPLGRKRRINQSSCNKDYSCVKGFCPSFVTVVGGTPKKARTIGAGDALFDALPAPPLAALGHDAFGVMIPGVGGTGVITVGAVLAMAAHLEGKAASTYDMTGLSQKNGAVYSHLQIARETSALRANRLGLGDADLVLGFDMIAALGDEAFRTIAPTRTCFVGNHRVMPTAALAIGADSRLEFGLLARKVEEKVPPERVAYVDATGLASALLGDAIATNFFLVGVALQRGWLPLSLASIERAIELNGVQVGLNRRALQFGRLWAHDASRIERMLGAGTRDSDVHDEPLEATIARRSDLLAEYQDAAYAARYRSLVERVRSAERRVSGTEGAFSLAVARQFAKLMAYKDEYEVARLYSSPEFRRQIERDFDGVASLRVSLAPPLWARPDAQTGRPRKREYGPWMFTAMRWLAKARRWRGGALDPFGRTAERRTERAWIDRYEQGIDTLLRGLTADRLELATHIAELPEQIRGFGPVKEANARTVDAQWRGLFQQWAEFDESRRLAA
jgi:indolepyruvate ferredoxin oxidoreductase